MKISEIQRGEHFSFSGFRWLAIEPTGSGTYALLDSVPELLKRRPFANLSTRRGKDLSDWKNSLARYVLRHTFLPELLSQNDQHAELLEMTVDLTALDGTGSSTFEDTIALLSLSQYQKHSDVIGETHAEFWTLTRASKKILDEMLTIKSDGTVRVNADPKFSASELRPVILLAPESEVEKKVRRRTRRHKGRNSSRKVERRAARSRALSCSAIFEEVKGWGLKKQKRASRRSSA